MLTTVITAYDDPIATQSRIRHLLYQSRMPSRVVVVHDNIDLDFITLPIIFPEISFIEADITPGLTNSARLNALRAQGLAAVTEGWVHFMRIHGVYMAKLYDSLMKFVSSADLVAGDWSPKAGDPVVAEPGKGRLKADAYIFRAEWGHKVGYADEGAKADREFADKIVASGGRFRRVRDVLYSQT